MSRSPLSRTLSPTLSKSTSRRSVLALTGGAAATLAGASLAPPAFAFDLLKGSGLQGLTQSAGTIAQGFMLSEGDEIQMGKTYYPEYLTKSGGAYDNANAQAALKAFAEPLIATSARKDLPWEITLVKNDAVNAWALPGGKLAINSGLVHYSTDPNQLASVIAHEIGHAELSHGLQQMKTQAFMSGLSQAGQLAIAATLGAAAPLTNQVFGALQGPLFNLINAGYSREREFQADNHILDVFTKTGNDPAKADDFFRTLLKLYPPSDSSTTSLFSTHPGTQDRINKIEARASSMKAGGASSDKNFAALKDILPTPSNFDAG
ncbi:MAG: M48 family metallopeptidase [Rhodospirillales bacterium]